MNKILDIVKNGATKKEKANLKAGAIKAVLQPGKFKRYAK
jgi:hypothetical protein